MAEFLPIDDAAKAVPCDVEILRKWLQQGHLSGKDSFGRCDQQITAASTGIMISVESLRRYCQQIGVQLNL